MHSATTAQSTIGETSQIREELMNEQPAESQQPTESVIDALDFEEEFYSTINRRK